MNLDGGELVGGKAASAYLMPWNRYFLTPKVSIQFLIAVLPRITTAPFSAEVAGKSMQFKRGTIVIPVVQRDADAKITAAELHRLMEKLVSEDHVQIYATNSSSTPSGPDLGGAYQGVLKKPHVALLSGAGTSAYGSGEIWHLIDNRMNIPVSRLNAENLNRNKLSKYNTIIFSGWILLQIG